MLVSILELLMVIWVMGKLFVGVDFEVGMMWCEVYWLC